MNMLKQINEDHWVGSEHISDIKFVKQVKGSYKIIIYSYNMSGFLNNSEYETYDKAIEALEKFIK